MAEMSSDHHSEYNYVHANDHSEHKYNWALSDTLHATCTYVHANE